VTAVLETSSRFIIAVDMYAKTTTQLLAPCVVGIKTQQQQQQQHKACRVLTICKKYVMLLTPTNKPKLNSNQ
jgi:hypothetical protein